MIELGIFDMTESTQGPLIHDRAEESPNTLMTLSPKVPRFDPSSPLPSSLTFMDNEETFEPLAALIKFETEEEVIILANGPDDGYFYSTTSRDIGKLLKCLRSVWSGQIMLPGLY